MSELAPWLALVLLGGALASVLAALLARALFVLCMYLAAAGALVAAAVALMGESGAALAIAALFAAFAPVLLLGAVLLSARTTKAQRRVRPWLSVGAAVVVAGAVFWVLPQIEPAPRVDGEAVQVEFVGTWLAPLVFVAVTACIGLLGFGERGAMQRAGEGGDL